MTVTSTHLKQLARAGRQVSSRISGVGTVEVPLVRAGSSKYRGHTVEQPVGYVSIAMNVVAPHRGHDLDGDAAMREIDIVCDVHETMDTTGEEPDAMRAAR